MVEGKKRGRGWRSKLGEAVSFFGVSGLGMFDGSGKLALALGRQVIGLDWYLRWIYHGSKPVGHPI